MVKKGKNKSSGHPHAPKSHKENKTEESPKHDLQEETPMPKAHEETHQAAPEAKPDEVKAHAPVAGNKPNWLVWAVIGVVVLAVLAIVLVGLDKPEDQQAATLPPPTEESPDDEKIGEGPVPPPPDSETKIIDDGGRLDQRKVLQVESELDAGKSTILSDTDFALNTGGSETMALGIMNRVGTKYFKVNYQFIEYATKSGVKRPDIKAEDWLSPVYTETFQLMKGDRSILPITAKVPSDAIPGTYRFSVSVCYFEPPGGIPDGGCYADQNKKLGSSQRINIVVG